MLSAEILDNINYFSLVDSDNRMEIKRNIKVILGQNFKLLSIGGRPDINIDDFVEEATFACREQLRIKFFIYSL